MASLAHFHPWLQVVHISYTLIAVLITVIALNYLRGRRRRELLSKLPSPPGKLPILGHMLRMQSPGLTINASVYREWTRLGREFAKDGLFYIKLGPTDSVFLSSPQFFAQVMSSSEHIDKAVAYKTIVPWLKTGLIVSGGQQWHHDRKLLTPSFHFKILEQFNPIMNKHARILCDVISSLDGQLSDTLKVISAAALDTICETAFGTDMKSQMNGDNDYSTNLHLFNQLAIKRTINPYLMNDLLYSVLPDGIKSAAAVRTLHKFTDEIIFKRKAELIELKTNQEDKLDGDQRKKKKLLSLLDLMLDIHFEGNLSLVDIRSQLDNFAFAGHDTVAMAMVNVLIQLANNEEAQDKLHAELDFVLRRDEDTDITSDHHKDLKYLDMVIKETLRLRPSAPFISRILKTEVTIGDYTIPPGVDLWFNISALHLNEDTFPKPDKFDPERFSDENSKHRHPFAYTPFSGGLRNCIGQRYAMNIMKIVLATLLKRFRVLPVTKYEDIVPSFEVTAKTMDPVAIKFESRS